MSAFLTALLAIIGPMLAQALQALLSALINKWKGNPAAAAILAEANTPDKLHAAMPKLLEAVAGDYIGVFERMRFNRLQKKLVNKPVTDAVWDHMLMTGDVEGEPTNVSFIAVLDAVQ